MVETGSSVNIIPLSIFKTTGVSRDRIVKQSIWVSRFEVTLGHISLELVIKPMRTMNKFHAIGGRGPSNHVLFGRPWIHQHKVVPSTYDQCVKVF